MPFTLPRWPDDFDKCCSASCLLLGVGSILRLYSFSCSAFIDRLDAPWPHNTTLEGAGHRNQTGKGHYQCRSHRALSQRSGSIFLWLHCEVASVPYYKQVKYQDTKGRSFCLGLEHLSTKHSSGMPVWLNAIGSCWLVGNALGLLGSACSTCRLWNKDFLLTMSKTGMLGMWSFHLKWWEDKDPRRLSQPGPSFLFVPFWGISPENMNSSISETWEAKIFHVLVFLLAGSC